MATVKMTPTFAKRALRLLGEADLTTLCGFLALHPDAGDVVAGTGGVRKLRWAMTGQGKRGGARVLHLYLKHREALWLLDLYAKREKADLSIQDRKIIRAMVAEIKRSAE